jgi:hypothetical protein
MRVRLPQIPPRHTQWETQGDDRIDFKNKGTVEKEA